jgi:hypothetical protein
MKFGLWFLSAAAIGAVGTVLAASLPVPPSLPRIATRPLPAPPTLVAAIPAPSTPAPPAARPASPPPVPAALLPAPAAPPPQAAAMPLPVSSPPAVERARRITAADIAALKHTAKRPIRHVAKATPDRHPRAVAHTASPHYVVVHKQPSPYPGMPVRPPTHVAMVPPPPYGLPPPYWRPPYPPE